jgi:Fic family protein
LRKIATLESIGSSTRIEGVVLTDQEIAKILSNVKITSLKTRDEQEVVGYYEALNTILESYEHIPLSGNHIKQLHKILLKFSDKDDRHRGEYKSASNAVVAKYPDGTEKTIFRTTEPYLVQKEMSEAIAWTNESLNNPDVHPLVIIACFIYEFLSIHPFQDGNGRLSRLLTTILLLKSGYHFVQYISFEHIIEEKKKDYYKALMQGQKNRYKKSEKIDRWVCFFLDCLENLIKKLQAKYDVYSDKGGYLNARQKDIIQFMKKRQPVKVSDIIDALPRHPKNTLKKDLIYLKNEGYIEQAGKYRGAVYLLKEKGERS